MKKNLILAAVAVMAVGPMANAAGGKEGRPEVMRARDAAKAKTEAGRSATTGADAGTTSVVASLKAAKLTQDARAEAELSNAMSSNPEIMAAAREAAVQGQSERFFELAKARVAGMANLRGIKTGVTAEALANLSVDAKNEQAYATLVLRAGKAAETWDAATVENLTFLLAKANEAISSGRTIAEAMREATATIAKSKNEGGRSVRLNLEDVNKFCK